MKEPIIHEIEKDLNPEYDDRDFITFVRNAANRAFRLLRAADEINGYLERSDQQLIEDVLAKGVLNVKKAANYRENKKSY